jgi:DNA primase
MRGRAMSMLSVTQRRSLERATLQYMNHLEEALDYLEARGIGEEVARSVGLGVVRDPIPGHEHLEGRLAIPYLTDFGPVNMNFRCLSAHKCKDEGHQKYMSWTGLETNLYSIQSMREADEWIAVTEGELDALSLNIAGVPAVGIAGANKWSEHWNNVFEDFTRVYVFQDGGEAGKKFGDTLVREVGALRVALPAGEDVNSVLVKHGAEYLRGRIRT